MRVQINGQTLELHQGDITAEQVDAIVNAANSRLAGGGGVDGAIHRRGGAAIMADTAAKYPDGCPTGSAVISIAGNLPAKHVIHAVGPVWSGGHRGEPALLAGAYRRALELAMAAGCRSIALPALSTGRLSLSHGPGGADCLGHGDRFSPPARPPGAGSLRALRRGARGLCGRVGRTAGR